MTLISQTFPPNLPRAAANYNFIDIAEGTGITKYYLTAYSLSGSAPAANTYNTYPSGFLTANQIYGNNVILSGSEGISSGSYTLNLTQNFDLKYNRPQIVKGTLYVSLTQGLRATTETIAGYSNVELQKINTASTVTTITSGFSDAFVTTGSNTSGSATKLMGFAVSGSSFKKNETLRIVVKAYCRTVSGTTGNMFTAIGIDPQNRADTAVNTALKSADTTQAIALVPYVIDL